MIITNHDRQPFNPVLHILIPSWERYSNLTLISRQFQIARESALMLKFYWAFNVSPKNTSFI